MKQSTKRLISTILALTFIFGAFLIFLNFIKPVYNETQVLRSEILNKEEEIANKKVIVNQVKSLIQEYQNQSQIQESLSSSLPPNPQIAEALIQISGLLDLNNINLLSFNVSKPTNFSTKNEFEFLKPIGVFEINIRGNGSYPNIQKFLSQLESNIRLFSVKNININSIISQNKNESANLFFDMTILSYYQVAN